MSSSLGKVIMTQLTCPRAPLGTELSLQGRLILSSVGHSSRVLSRSVGSYL